MMENTDPANNGGWEDKGYVITNASDKELNFNVKPDDWTNCYYKWNAIDPSYIIDKDGKHYLVYGSWHSGIAALEVDAATGKPLNTLPKPWGTEEDIAPYGQLLVTRQIGNRWQASEGPEIIYNPNTIRTQNFDPSSYNYSTPRSSIKDVYETVIIPDLKQAELLMQFKGSELNLPVGRATKGAAKALLSKVYLHIASASMPDASVYVKCGYQSNANSFRTSQVGNNVEVFTKDVVKGYEAFDSNSYFQLAMEKSKELIAIEGSVSGYKLKNTFMNTFQNLQTDDEEVIFVLGTANDPNFMSRYLDYYSYKSGDIAYSKWIGRGYIFVSNAFYNSYKEEEYGSIDDQRIKDGFSHLYRKYDNTGNYTWRVYPDTERDIYQEQVPNETLLDENDAGFTTKYDWFNGSSADKYTDATLPFLRYADVLLMYAEAMNEVHGPTFVDEFGKSTIDYVNVVRGRSDAKLVSFDTEYAMNASKLSERIGMRSFILAERGRELYQELNRAFDLKRWGVYLQVMNKVNAVRNIGKARQERNLLYPLPKSEMDANMYIESNNPG